MNKSSLLAVTALLLSATCFAEEEEPAVVPAVPTNAPVAKTFTALPLCRRVEGGGQVRKPGGDWVPAEEGRFYPFGTSYRADKGGMLTVAFGSGSTVTVADGAEFGTRCQEVGIASRTIVLVRGTLVVRLPENLAEGMFFATAPGFTVKNPAGESRLTYADRGDGDEAVVRCVTGTLGVEGRHFGIATMHAANEVRIRTTRDHLSTILYGTSGDYVVRLDQGQRFKEEFDDSGAMKTTVENGVLEWHLSPYTKVIINRSVPAIGERMSVHTMASDAAGERKSECYFCEGRAEVNSGELVAVRQADGEDIAKRAAEVTETTATAEGSEEKAEESKQAPEAEKTASKEEE